MSKYQGKLQMYGRLGLFYVAKVVESLILANKQLCNRKEQSPEVSRNIYVDIQYMIKMAISNQYQENSSFNKWYWKNQPLGKKYLTSHFT